MSKLVWNLWEWLWRGEAISAAEAQEPSTSLQFFEHRARVAAEVGQRTLNPTEPWPSGDATHVAAALFAESIAWSLRAAAAKPSKIEAGEPWPAEAPTTSELAELLDGNRTSLAAAARDDSAQLARVQVALLERVFERPSLSARERERIARELGAVAVRLMLTQSRPLSTLDFLRLQRWRRVGTVLLLLLALVGAGAQLKALREARANLAAGKPWKTSSAHEQGCISPAQRCDQVTGYFFHTREESSPWIEVDLSSEQLISRVQVHNRADCCTERAVPLVVEVSTDHTHWQEVQRRTQPFTKWKASFPATSARWIRFRVPRRSYLHLSEVRVLK
jgi:hypothetical protein